MIIEFPVLHQQSALASRAPAQTVPALLEHTTVSDWQTGQHDAGSTITHTRDGELALTPQTVDMLPWSELVETPLPTALHDHELLTVNDSLYLIGGESSTGISASVHRAVIGANGSLLPWQPLPSLPEPRSLHRVVQAGNSLLVVGGVANNEPDEVPSVIYRAVLTADGGLSDWEALPAPILPSRLEEAGVVVVNGSLFVIGGTSAESEVLNTVYRAALRADGTPHTWEIQQPLPIGLEDYALAAQGECLFAVGGNTAANISNQVYSARVDAAEGITIWHELVSNRLPVQRKSHTATIIGGSLVAIGGNNGLPDNDGETVYRAAIHTDCTLDPWEEWTDQALPRQLVNHAAAAANGFLFVAGGNRYGNSELYDIIYRAALVPERYPGNWQHATTEEQHLPAGLSGHAAAINDDILLVTGGSSSGSIQTQVYASSALTCGLPGAWYTVSPLPQPLHEHGTVATGARFWTIGGNDGQADQRTVYTADVQADGSLHAWETHPCALPQSLSSLAAVVIDDAIYLSGGRSGYEEQAHIYRLQTDSADTGTCWQTVGTLPVPLAEHAMTYANGSLFVSGGVTDAGGDLLDTVYTAPVLDDGTIGAWQELTSSALPMKLRSHSMLAIHSYLYLAGGMDGGLPLARHELFRAPVLDDGTIGAWQELTSSALPDSRYNHAAVATDLYLGIIGGRHNEQDTADILVAPLYAAAQQATSTGEFDLGRVQNIGELTWHVRGDPGVALEVRCRIADESGVYGSWSSAGTDRHLAIYNRGRYVQYLLQVTNPASGVQAIDAIRLSYGAVGDFVRVVDEDGANVAGAAIYLNGDLLGTTNQQGVLAPEYMPPGRSADDHLVVLNRVHEQATARDAHHTEQNDSPANWSYRTYLTSLVISDTGTLSAVAPQSGGQIIQVQRESPLILFNLVISLEWNADDAYLEEIAQAMSFAADYLFDISDGQMAFERVAIYDNAAHWVDADIQISTKNIVRPHAYIGGITGDDPVHVIRIGRHWDGRTGNSGPWDEPEGYRTLVHEFGHYALYLYDEYFYYLEKDNGELERLPGACTRSERHQGDDTINASIMDYQYHSSELGARGVSGMWESLCEQTEQWRLNGESDWETVQRFYSDTHELPRWLIRTPQDRGAVMAGPERFPTHWLPFPVIELHNGETSGLSLDLTVLNPRGQPHPGALVTLETLQQGVRQPIDQGLTNGAGQITIMAHSKAMCCVPVRSMVR
ncbi:MAG: hypothetical protein HC884_04755 [Chloroflexaceae bacterium]|nr:hypothetical protein [Chloroflexaceae bacterium]